MSEQEPLPPSCKSCKHYCLTLGMRLNLDTAPRCRRTSPEPKYNVVTGKFTAITRIDHLQRCEYERSYDDHDYRPEKHCGFRGRFWIPRNDKDVFKAVQHITYLETYDKIYDQP